MNRDAAEKYVEHDMNEESACLSRAYDLNHFVPNMTNCCHCKSRGFSSRTFYIIFMFIWIVVILFVYVGHWEKHEQ